MNYSFFRNNAEKVRQEMRKQGMDVVILTHQQKYSYVAGTYHNDFNLGNCIFVWADEEPTLLTALAERGRLQQEGYIKDLRCWTPAYAGLKPRGLLENVMDILEEHDCVNKVIGVELPSIAFVVMDFLRNNLN